jgi:hypothetical protein
MSLPARTWTIAGLVLGAIGIGILWAAGVEFPVAIPPGAVILLVGAVFVTFAPWRWSPAVGTALGLFVAVGFAVSPTGFDNLFGRHGASVATGQAIQLIGVLTAVVAGVIATRDRYKAGQTPAG